VKARIPLGGRGGWNRGRRRVIGRSGKVKKKRERRKSKRRNGGGKIREGKSPGKWLDCT
jgi:hypothetical protein